MVNLIFVFDEVSDVATDATAPSQNLACIMKDALRNPHKPRPKDEHVLGEVTRQCVPLLFASSSLPQLTLTCLEIPGQGSWMRLHDVPETQHCLVGPLYRQCRPRG